VPLAPEAIVIHGAELVAVHAQPIPVVTFTVLNAEAAVSETLVVDRTTLHSGAACVTVNTRPPTVSDPVRAAVVVFAAIEYWTVPFPEPEAPLVTVNQATELAAVQVHPAAVVTLTDPVDASEPDDTVVGEIVISHVPACAMVTVWPAIVTVPVRDDAAVFAATNKVTAPFPPLFGPAPAVIVIHAALLDALQTQPDGDVTETTRLPPAASNDSAVEDRVAPQAVAAWLTVNRRPPTAIVPVRVVPAAFGATL